MLNPGAMYSPLRRRAEELLRFSILCGQVSRHHGRKAHGNHSRRRAESRTRGHPATHGQQRRALSGCARRGAPGISHKHRARQGSRHTGTAGYRCRPVDAPSRSPFRTDRSPPPQTRAAATPGKTDSALTIDGSIAPRFAVPGPRAPRKPLPVERISCRRALSSARPDGRHHAAPPARPLPSHPRATAPVRRRPNGQCDARPPAAGSFRRPARRCSCVASRAWL